MRSRSGIVGSASAILIIVHTAAFAQTPSAESCASLARQQLPGTKITTAEAISTGSFTPPGSTNVIGNLPPFCRVAGVIAPTPESQILFEVWLPLDNWNGKFAGVGALAALPPDDFFDAEGADAEPFAPLGTLKKLIADSVAFFDVIDKPYRHATAYEIPDDVGQM